MAKAKRISQEEFETVVTGGEPIFGAKVLEKLDLVTALNWYSANRERKNSQKYIFDYFKKNKLNLDEKKIDEQPNTVGWLCRMTMRGAKLSTKDKLYLDSKISDLKLVEEKEKKDNVVSMIGPSIQERVRQKAIECIGELDGAIDKFIISKGKEEVSPLSIMMEKSVKGMQANTIVETFKTERDEWEDVLNTIDPQVKEGYAKFKKSDLKKIIGYYQRIIDDAQTVIGEAKKARKPRKRKQKTPEQLVGKMKYCVEDKELKIKSVDPKTIIGANSVWVYNKKTRKLGCYLSDDVSGLTVKGSTIQNFAKTKSIAKNVRKPAVIIPEVLNGGKVFLRNVLSDIRAKEIKMNGRINKDTLVLKVIK